MLHNSLTLSPRFVEEVATYTQHMRLLCLAIVGLMSCALTVFLHFFLRNCFQEGQPRKQMARILKGQMIRTNRLS